MLHFLARGMSAPSLFLHTFSSKIPVVGYQREIVFNFSSVGINFWGYCPLNTTSIKSHWSVPLCITLNLTLGWAPGNCEITFCYHFWPWEIWNNMPHKSLCLQTMICDVLCNIWYSSGAESRVTSLFYVTLLKKSNKLNIKWVRLMELNDTFLTKNVLPEAVQHTSTMYMGAWKCLTILFWDTKLSLSNRKEQAEKVIHTKKHKKNLCNTLTLETIFYTKCLWHYTCITDCQHLEIY